MSIPDEETLSAVLGSPIRAIEPIPPWAVARVELDGDPSSVVVKSVRDNPEGWRMDPAQLVTEAAALRFVAALGLDVAPKLIAFQRDRGMLIIEDLAPRVPLAPSLPIADAAARNGLIAFARATARLHAGTSGRHERWLAMHDGATARHMDLLSFMRGHWKETAAQVEAIGADVPDAVDAEMDRTLSELAAPGPFMSFSNGDCGTNNFLLEPGRPDDGRIIDFEHAGYNHAFMDARCLFVPGPMWMTVRDGALDGVEDAYRTTLAETVPEADDGDAYGSAMAGAALVGAFQRLHRIPKMEPRPPGDPSRAQMVSTLEAAASVAARHRRWPALTGFALGISEHLRRRWPDTDVELIQDRYTWRDPEGAAQVFGQFLRTG